MNIEAAFGVYMLTLALICVSVYGCFRGIAWVIQHGWRSMLGLVDECTTKHGDDVRAERDSLRERFDEARRTIAALRSELYDRRFEGGEHG